MQIQENISLKPYNTFGIEVIAKQFASVSSTAQLLSILNNCNEKPFVLGGGSNMLLTQDIDALVLHINTKGITFKHHDDKHVLVTAQAGENWHEFVLWCLNQNFGGIENLSLIPGNIGTAPIQNIGAYGVELKDVFHSCQAIHIESKSLKTFTKEDCKFGYRESVFKQDLKGQYIITEVTLCLTSNSHQLKTSYGAITDQLEAMKISTPTISSISDAVIAIRESKLPDPKKIGNSGSFFKNPVINKEQYEQLLINFPNMPCYKVSQTQVKVPAGWLIEHAGFKGKTLGNYGVHKKQALVLVNYDDANGQDIFELAKFIQKTIFRLFGITIDMEVNVI
ncbi:MAG: UDP-N-acetylenolpyruvoylglucosamine reductase [Bacteroidetes bacterium MedPE-SWsnd-G2]|nr:MAG: UDP-N-acetylenolpyruvoylglucosamine reductase [Bacteroidetes bacterium MedPE-SWsnd-G2]